MVAPPDNSPESNFNNLSHHTGEGVILDIGTGDGLFVYQSARQNPRKFFIGIDPNTPPLEKVSEKIHRKPNKGGAKNALFIQAAVEDLPSELDGIADEVHVHFPWGSLLRAVASGDLKVLQGIRKVCAHGAVLEVVIGLDDERDVHEIERLRLEQLSEHFIDSVLSRRYLAAQFELVERGILLASDWPKIKTSWAKRLQGRSTRSITYWIARAI